MVVFDRDKIREDGIVNTARSQFNDPRIQWCNVFPSPHVNNWSGTDARNLAIQSGSSPWIAYIDDDDAWMPEHLETFVKMAKKGGTMLRSRGAMVQYRRRYPRRSEKIRQRVSYHDHPMTVGMAHTRTLFELTPGWQPIDNHDWQLWADLRSAGGVPLTTNKVTFEFLR